MRVQYVWQGFSYSAMYECIAENFILGVMYECIAGNFILGVMYDMYSRDFHTRQCMVRIAGNFTLGNVRYV